MTCKDCIHFDVCQELRCGDISDCNSDDCGGFFKNKADYVKVKHATWYLNKNGSGMCSNCRVTQKDVWDFDKWQTYCGHCGAKMDGSDTDES